MYKTVHVQKQCEMCFGTGRVWAPDPVKTFPNEPHARQPSRPSSATKRPPTPPPISQPKVTCYEGEKMLFRRHGSGRAEHLGGLIYEGRWSFGKWSGAGELRCGEAWVYVGKFKRGLIHGHGKLELLDGTVFEGRFRNGYPISKGTLKFADGSHFQGKWNGCGTAKGKYVAASGERLTGKINNGDLEVKRGLLSRRKVLARFHFREIFST